MSQTEKAALYKELKDAGVQFSKHYREYSTQELQEGVAKLRASRPQPDPDQEPLFETPPAPEPTFDPEATAAAMAAMSQPQQPQQPSAEQLAAMQARVNREAAQQVAQQQAEQGGLKQPSLPRSGPNPDEMPGERLNSQAKDEPIRVDEHGLVWFQEEVRKPAAPRPRGRRVLKYLDTGVKEERVKNGEYVETFEVAGVGEARPAEVKITLPSYQVGIYKDPRLPFKIHVYNGNRGFDLFEVQNYYGGAELVPTDIKRIYVENVLCYDIRTTVRAIQTEYRHLQLQGKVK